MLPTPPESAAPPMTTAAMAVSSYELPAVGLALVSSEDRMRPAIAAQRPEIT